MPMEYEADDSAALETAFRKNQNGSEKVRGGSYEVNFQTMTQKNIQSGFSRAVSRSCGKVMLL